MSLATSSPNLKPASPPSGPCPRVHGLPCHQCSQVLATRKVLTLVPPRTLVKVPTAVWSRSVSSWKTDSSEARSGTTGNCGAVSRSHRTAQVWLAVIW